MVFENKVYQNSQKYQHRVMKFHFSITSNNKSPFNKQNVQKCIQEGNEKTLNSTQD